MEITIGNLVDRLTICNLRIWKAEDIKRNPEATDSEVRKATEITNRSNTERNLIIEAIDEAMNAVAKGKQQQQFGQGSTKMYGK